MSYNRSYSESIIVRGSKSESFSYPSSERGGSMTVTIDYEEHVPVDVNIHVDTNPFDRSINNCNTNVNLLTGAVIASEAAQIASIDHNSQKVGSTIVSGFFSYIRSEISQQISELTQNIDAQLMHLKELAISCSGKKKQMEGDYTRISGRYVKIFEDLNNELSNRIVQLDKPTFVFKEETDQQKIRATKNDLVSTVTVFGSDSGDLQCKIGASIAKKRALDTINKAKIFLWQQQKLNTTIQQSMLKENVACTVYSPVCFVETKADKNQLNQHLYSPEYLPVIQENECKNILLEKFTANSSKWRKVPTEYNESLKLYFNTELNSTYSSNDQRSLRVREMIQRIARLGSVEIINFQNN